jgi:AraC-like DNA-binding protein
VDYISVKEAAQKWGISERRIQYLCNNGRVPDAGRLGRMWLIPSEAKAPEDQRVKNVQPQEKEAETSCSSYSQPGSLDADVFSESGAYALFFEIIRKLPLVLHIFRPDGTFFYGNEAYCKMMGIKNKTTYDALKTMNALTDPDLKKWGLQNIISQALRGETVHVYDIRVPLKDISVIFGDNEPQPDQILYQNFHSFPITDSEGVLRYVATIFEISRTYQGRDEINRGKDYIESHWMEKFNLKEVAGVSSLSRSHFIKMFREHTGLTPHQYHQRLKIQHAQKLLQNPNIPVTRAFAECGMEYNSHYLETFRQYTGMTPMEYRKTHKNSLDLP